MRSLYSLLMADKKASKVVTSKNTFNTTVGQDVLIPNDICQKKVIDWDVTNLFSQIFGESILLQQ